MCNCSCVFIYVRITDEIVIAGNQRNERIYKYVCGELQKKHLAHQIIQRFLH